MELKRLNNKNTKRKLVFSLLLLYMCNWVSAQMINIIPEPNSIKVENKWMIFNQETISISFQGFQKESLILKQLDSILQKQLGISLTYNSTPTTTNEIAINIEKDKSIKNKEGYSLSIIDHKILLKASNTAGLFYGIQTLEQYLMSFPNIRKEKKVKEVQIEDAPRFGYRALMLDPARHFIPVKDVKRYIDLMAHYKFNTLHFHLADDHGWCLEMKDYPRLTEIGSKRDASPHDGFLISGFYTKEDLKELVNYASLRNVEIMPEIDIPGHGHTLLTAYPEFACFPDTTLKAEITEDYPHTAPICIGNPKFYSFYEDIIKTLAEIFPGHKLHVGGDEVNTEHWAKCPKCQALKTKENLKEDEELMDYLFAKVNVIAEKYNKDLVFWYEGGHKYPKGKTVTLWRSNTSKQVIDYARENHMKLVCAPGEYCYLDYAQSATDKHYMPKWIPVLPLQKVYEFDPAYGLSKKDSKFIIGIETTMWGESIKDIDRLFYMTYPRAFALSEAAWTKMKHRSWNIFKQKLQLQLQYLLERGVNYRPPIELAK